MCVQKIVLCPFQCKPRPSGVSLEFLGLENILQVPEYRPEVSRTQDASKAVSATLSVLSEVGVYFGPESPKCAFKKLCCPFQCKPRPSGVSLESPGLENIPQVPGIGAEVDQIHDARNVVSVTVSVLKSSVPIFRSTSYKVSVQKVLLCPFHFKTRPSGLSLASKGLENIAQIPGNPFEVRQNYDIRKAVSATLSVLK